MRRTVGYCCQWRALSWWDSYRWDLKGAGKTGVIYTLYSGALNVSVVSQVGRGTRKGWHCGSYKTFSGIFISLDRADNPMDSIVTQLATLAIDRLTQWAFCLTPSWPS